MIFEAIWGCVPRRTQENILNRYDRRAPAAMTTAAPAPWGPYSREWMDGVIEDILDIPDREENRWSSLSRDKVVLEIFHISRSRGMVIHDSVAVRVEGVLVGEVYAPTPNMDAYGSDGPVPEPKLPHPEAFNEAMRVLKETARAIREAAGGKASEEEKRRQEAFKAAWDSYSSANPFTGRP